LSAYLLGKLTGKPQPMTYSEASWTGLMDREELQWHQGLLNLLGIHHTTLPALCDADDLYNGGIGADYIKRWPELTKTSWARGIGEAAAFNVGTGCDGGSRRRICVSMGTSAAIRVCIPCKDRLYPHKSSGNGHKGGAHSQDGGRKLGNGAKKSDDKDIEVPPGLCRYSVKRDLMLVGGSLADGGSIYAWGTEQLAGNSPALLSTPVDDRSLFLIAMRLLCFFRSECSDPISGTRSPQEDWKKWRSCKQRQQRWNVTPTVSLCCRFSAAAAVREAVGYVPPIPPPRWQRTSAYSETFTTGRNENSFLHPDILISHFSCRAPIQRQGH